MFHTSIKSTKTDDRLQPTLCNLKDLTINSSNTADNRKLPSYDDEVNIPVVPEVVRASKTDVGASKTDEQSPIHSPALLVEVFDTTVINVSEWSVIETLTKFSILYSVGVESIYSMGGRGQ